MYDVWCLRAAYVFVKIHKVDVLTAHLTSIAQLYAMNVCIRRSRFAHHTHTLTHSHRIHIANTCVFKSNTGIEKAYATVFSEHAY